MTEARQFDGFDPLRSGCLKSPVCIADLDHEIGIAIRPEQGSGGPSLADLIGHLKDSLWSIDLFRCECANPSDHVFVDWDVESQGNLLSDSWTAA